MLVRLLVVAAIFVAISLGQSFLMDGFRAGTESLPAGPTPGLASHDDDLSATPAAPPAVFDAGDRRDLLAPFLWFNGWYVRSFDAYYQINPDGSIDAVEDIQIDFGTLERRGILRDIPVEYEYDAKNRRIIDITVLGVDDGERPHRYEAYREGAYLTIRIGDPNVWISGEQRYRISYRVQGALNPQERWDEFYWNVTGNDWDVPIENASAVATAPELYKLICFEGYAGVDTNCAFGSDGATAYFQATRPFGPNEGLTIVVAMPKGAVDVPPFTLVPVKTEWDKVKDFTGLRPLPAGLAGLLAVMGPAVVVRYWWLAGRDRWYGDVHYLTGATEEHKRPFFARDTVVVEYQPPEIRRQDRRLRPAEIGTLLDERADTLDVTATLVDLAIRGYLRIVEVPKPWLFGKVDYQLERLKPADSDLLPYERRLHTSLFETGDQVLMSSLRNKFYSDLAKVKEALYKQMTDANHFFPHNPETMRRYHLVAGVILIVVGGYAVAQLGQMLSAAILGVPLVLTGLVLAVMSGSMSRRTADGREMYRRCLGFREYMTVAETDRQRFYADTGIFEQYLPYAIVYGCVDKWTKAFEQAGIQPGTTAGNWYVSNQPFRAAAFSRNLQSFSSSMSSAIASTPGGSGGSGFSGGSSGGGGGGGGGRSW